MLAQIAGFTARLISLYSFFIWIRIIMSWFNPWPREGSITWYFAKLVDPYLNLFRSKKFVIGYFDFSPLLAVGLLAVIQSLLNIYSVFQVMTLSLVIQMMLSAFWTYALSLLLIILIILLAIRTIGAFMHSYGLSGMNAVTENIIRKAQNLFFPNRIVNETTLCVITLAIAVLAWFASRWLIGFLIALAARIPF